MGDTLKVAGLLFVLLFILGLTGMAHKYYDTHYDPFVLESTRS